MLVQINSTIMKILVSNLHPDPCIRVLAHLNVAMKSPFSFVVDMQPTLFMTMVQAVPVLEPTLDAAEYPLSNLTLRFHGNLLGKEGNMATILNPRQETIEFLLETEKKLYPKEGA